MYFVYIVLHAKYSSLIQSLVQFLAKMENMLHDLKTMWNPRLNQTGAEANKLSQQAKVASEFVPA